ncbi:MAG: cobalamin-binding protein [Bacteroidales bacterium]|nr:cobalamin-binding protein [Bacteroidales bacterium]
MSDLRIISLIPSATETVYALGLGKYLVGRSHDCDFPEQAKELPVCSAPRFQSIGKSKEINRAVEDILKEAVSIYNIDLEKIKELKPTHIITQSQCRVCAVSTDEIERLLQEYIRENPVKFIDLNPETLDHALADFVKLSTALGHFDKGFKLRIAINKEMQSISMKANMQGKNISVAVLEWMDPLMVAGHWMHDILELASVKNVCPKKEKKQKISFDELREKDPEKIIIVPCGFEIKKTLQETPALRDNSGWKDLRAVKNSAVYLVDGSAYFNRPGPRLLDSLQILTEILYPGEFEKKHGEKDWIQINNSYNGKFHSIQSC